jgi:PAS domain S-box-containing protein
VADVANGPGGAAVIPLPLIVGLDVLGTAALVAAAGILLWRRGRPLRGLGPLVLLSLLLLGLLEETANFLEASGYLPEAGLFEDSLAALFPTVWLGLFAMELERDDRERLTQTHERFRAVHDLALKLTMTLEPQAVMDEVVDAASRLLGAPFVVVLTPDAARETLAAQASRGISPDELRAWCFAMHEGMGGTAFLENRTLRTDQPGRDLAPPARPIVARHGIAAAVSIPLLLQGEAVGVLNVGRKGGETFSDEDIHLLETLCADAAVAIENARLYAKVVESEAKYRVLVENAQVAITAVDADRTVRFWNRGAERLFGWTADELLGRSISVIYSKDKLEEVQRTILAGLNRDGAWSGEFQLARKDGTPFTGFLSLTRIFDAHGKALGSVGFLADVTERVQLREQLFQAQKMQTVGTLAAGIAHDFNNLLTAILGFADMLAASLPPGTEDHEAAVSIQVAAQRGTQLVRQIKSFSHAQPLLREPLNLNLIVQEIVDLLRRTFPKNIAFETHLASHLYTIEADAPQMHQVLMNLAVNARDAMPDGGTLRITTENIVVVGRDVPAPALKAGRCVTVTVADTGQGIPPEIQSRVFEPFFTTKADIGGTGLGLSTAYAIIMRHGGTVTFKSQPGQGTTFRIVLPAVEQPAAVTSAHR